MFLGSIDLSGLDNVEWEKMFSLPKEYWTEDIREAKQFLDDQVGCDLPEVIKQQLEQQEERINNL